MKDIKFELEREKDLVKIYNPEPINLDSNQDIDLADILDQAISSNPPLRLNADDFDDETSYYLECPKLQIVLNFNKQNTHFLYDLDFTELEKIVEDLVDFAKVEDVSAWGYLIDKFELIETYGYDFEFYLEAYYVHVHSRNEVSLTLEIYVACYEV